MRRKWIFGAALPIIGAIVVMGIAGSSVAAMKSCNELYPSCPSLDGCCGPWGYGVPGGCTGPSCSSPCQELVECLHGRRNLPPECLPPWQWMEDRPWGQSRIGDPWPSER